MKKILCLIDGLSSGGAQRQLVGLADLLKTRGYDVLFVWYHTSNFYEDFLRSRGINYKQLRTRGRLSKFLSVYHVVKDWRPNTIIAYIDGPTMMVSTFKALGLKSQLIVSERNVIQSINGHQKLKFFLYRWSDFIVSNAKAQTDLINENFPHLQSKTVTIHNFVDTNFFSPSNKDFDPTEINILVIGRLSKQKNMISFMKAIKMVVNEGFNIHVKWFGNQNPNQKKYIDDTFIILKELELERVVEFLPPTSDVLAEYRQCNVFCLPSLYEGFPNVICEAMSCGCPILCSDVCDNSFMVYNNINGLLFNPNSVEDIAEKIKTFCLKDKASRLEMGIRSRKIALEKFSGDEFVNKYINLIES